MSRLPARPFQEAFGAWTQAAAQIQEGEVTAIDGKRLRRSPVCQPATRCPHQHTSLALSRVADRNVVQVPPPFHRCSQRRFGGGEEASIFVRVKLVFLVEPG